MSTPSSARSARVAVPSGLPVARRVSIRDLFHVRAFDDLTTAELPRRSAAAKGSREPAVGIEVITHCTPDACVDGVRDAASGSVLVAAALSADDRAALSASDGAWLERVARTAYVSARFVSLYIAESSYTGGAHANNVLTCATFDRRTGREVTLGDVLVGAPHLRARVQALLDHPNLAIDVLGEPLDGPGFTLSSGLLFEQATGRRSLERRRARSRPDPDQVLAALTVPPSPTACSRCKVGRGWAENGARCSEQFRAAQGHDACTRVAS